MSARALILPLALLVIAGSAPSADLKWKRINVDRSKKGKWDAKVVLLEARPGNALTRAAARAMRADAAVRMGEFLRSARSESNGSAPDRHYTFGETPEVFTGKPDLLSIVVDSGSYEGGAHPYTYEVCENWATIGGKPRRLTLPDLLAHGVKDVEKVSLLVMGKLRDRDGAVWVQRGEVRELTPTTRDCFAITSRGLTFIFSPYVMGPYSSGEIAVDLSWTELKGLANPTGPLKPVIR